MNKQHAKNDQSNEQKENQCVETNKMYNNVNIHIKVSKIIMAKKSIKIMNMYVL